MFRNSWDTKALVIGGAGRARTDDDGIMSSGL